MQKPTKSQKKIVAAISKLPEEMEPEELEALICSLISAYVGFEDTPGYLLYLHLKTARIQAEMMEQANKGMKH
jgi:hypothetical protein